MGWIVVTLTLAAMASVFVYSSSRAQAARRRDRLETAFLRARGQRMTHSGVKY